MDITQDELKRVLRYELGTGEWFWQVRFPNVGIKPGDKAGGLRRESKGDPPRHYRRIKYRGREYVATRLAWLYMTGQWPPHFVDHIDGDTLNDRWLNLRLATNTQNQWNSGAQVNNTTGYKGVFPSGNIENPWRARIRFHGRRIEVGAFPTAEAAHEAYKAAAERLHGEFANGGGDD